MKTFTTWLISLKWLPRRIVRSVFSLAQLFYFKPQYTFLAAAVSVLFYELIFWFLNLGLAHFLLTTPFLTFADKFELVVASYSGIFTYPFSSLAIILFLVSVLQGMAVAGLVYMMRSERDLKKSMAKELGGTGVAGAFSVLGLGCAACGTSLVTPLVSFFFASSSAAMTDVVGFYSALVALLVGVVTVYLVGVRLSTKLVV